MKEIIEIISSIEDNSVYTNIKPTEIYNEGWMTRLLVHYSKQQNIKLKEIDFEKIDNWTSEALLSSPFIKAAKIREGYTHTDIALGDFKVNYKQNGVGSGKIIINDLAKVFGVIEAKMGSPLSSFTSNAKNYNQATRTITCIAENTKLNCFTFFYVVLPECKVDKRNKKGITIRDLVKPENIKFQIEKRILDHNESNDVKLIERDVFDKVDKCIVGIITYEEWIELFSDVNIKSTLNDFYSKCKKWNNI
ncbi:hypothetical protein [Flavobacterium frigidarium]|uniref:hypothetical protein n=1 Tax=Flavobacterium frigidarium TaxID=99286 RepID=UPI0003F7BC1E|nr:hypothetical protein [Flavobacterium frigidarium]|tara:strand:+ start:1527 stop:2273 length:747 start_codon:yes stop_codon:yes gene_type:complete